MSDIEFVTQVVGADKAINDIRDAIDKGIRDSARGRTGLGNQIEERAKATIQEEGAIFTGELINSFNYRYVRVSGKLILRVWNDSDHAAPIEYGAEYTTKGPPVAALIPWVEAKMQGFTLPPDFDFSPSTDLNEEDRMLETPDGMVDVTDVASETVVSKAFWLQQHIKENGIDAIGFMKDAERWAEENGADTVAAFIQRRL